MKLVCSIEGQMKLLSTCISLSKVKSSSYLQVLSKVKSSASSIEGQIKLLSSIKGQTKFLSSIEGQIKLLSSTKGQIKHYFLVFI